MEMHAALIGAGCMVISGILIYIISLLTMKEKTYEEVMEEQKRKKEEFLQKPKDSKKEKAEKKNKKKSKAAANAKTKEKNSAEDQMNGENPAEEEAKPEKMVQLEIEPEIIPPAVAATTASAAPVETKQQSPAPGTARQRKGKKDKHQKPILINKDEKPLVKTDSKEKDNLVASPQYHKPTPPLDDVELLHKQSSSASLTKLQDSSAAATTGSKSAETSTPHKQQEGKPKKVKLQLEEGVVQSTQAPVTKSTDIGSGEQPSRKQKAKRSVEASAGDQSSGHFEDLLSRVHLAALSQHEIQALTDELLGKQAATQQWTKNSKKVDPVTALSKQLADQSARVEQAEAESLAASSKLKELKQELHMERQKFAMYEKQSTGQMAGARDEITALHQRMQQSHEQHSVEMQKYLMQIEQLKSNTAAMEQMRNENMQLKQANKQATQQAQAIMQNQGDYNQLKQQNQILQEELSKNTVALNSTQNKNQRLEAKVSKYEGEMQKISSGQQEKVAMLTKHISQMKEELRCKQLECDELAKEKEHQSSEMQLVGQEAANLRNTVKTLQDHQAQGGGAVQGLQEQLKDSESEKQQLQGQLTKLQDVDRQLQDLKTKYDSLEIIQRKGEQSLLTVTSEKAALTAEVQMLKKAAADVEKEQTEKQQSSAPAVTAEAVQKAEQLHQQKLAEQEKAHQVQIEQLQKDLQAQKDKNNALRERNWKAMDALTLAEKRAEKCQQLQQDLESKDAAILSLTEKLKTCQNGVSSS